MMMMLSLGEGRFHMKEIGVLIGISKRMPKRYQDQVLWARIESFPVIFFFLAQYPKRYCKSFSCERFK